MKDNIELLKSAMSSSIAKTIENMTFEEVDEEVEAQAKSKSAEQKCWSILPILNPIQGNLILEVSAECVKLFIENLYSEFEEDKINDNTVNDILSEILNTIGGRFMTSLLPPEQDFELGLPSSGQGVLPQQKEIITSKSTYVGQNIITVSVTGNEFKNLDSIRRYEHENISS